ncbi:MAG: DUF1549 domain-containing protein [Labilithrix sp.]
MKRSILFFALALAAVAACDSSNTSDLGGSSARRGSSGAGGGDDDDSNTTSGANGTGANGTGANAKPTDNRVTDYGEALRSASLKLVGELPTLAEIKSVGDAADDGAKKAALAAAVDKYLADPRFTEMQIQWWRNTFKTGADTGARPAAGAPSLDTAATFAAEVVVKDRPYTDLLTATTGTCPTFANGNFTDANCNTNAKVSGVLTDPGLMSQYTSNMAFRRVRFVQETFDCTKFPTELKGEGVPMGAGTYTSPWAFESISGGTGSKVDFHDTSAVICANCHSTMNHIAPLFANFDAKGQFQNSIQVQTPVTPPVTSILSDWLPSGESLAWRSGTTVTDIPSLGQAMAKDPEVLACAVTRVWNWALSRGDVVNDGAVVPASVIKDQVTAFTTGGTKLKPIIRAVFTSDDFAKF